MHLLRISLLLAINKDSVNDSKFFESRGVLQPRESMRAGDPIHEPPPRHCIATGGEKKKNKKREKKKKRKEKERSPAIPRTCKPNRGSQMEKQKTQAPCVYVYIYTHTYTRPNPRLGQYLYLAPDSRTPSSLRREEEYEKTYGN